MKARCIFLLACVLPLIALSGQEEDLLSLVEQEEQTQYITGTFKTNRIVHGHSIETTPGGVLDVKIFHRFGRLNTGFFELFGLDNAMVRLGAAYGITDRFTLGIGRSSFRDIYDGFLKFKLLRQSTGKKKMPISLVGLVSLEATALKNNPNPDGGVASRFAYTYQLMMARKFGDNFSLQIMPTLVHRNLVEFDEQNDVLALGFAARQKITNRIAATVEYYYVPGNQLPTRESEENEFHNSLSIGFDIETGGHVFQLHFTNSTSMVHRGFIPETDGQWADGDIHFGFNISRVFTLKKPDLE
ncbi:MAG: DUF5777 family beta-barrel protein [Saprospiraceae bacterium]|nr:DUF5777 family beta-barrel protein [Saprospiraceae bacterium]